MTLTPLSQPIVEDIIPLDTPIPGRKESFIRVQPGQIISIPLRDGINSDPRIWGEDAAEFRPERWFEPGAAERGPGLGGLLTFGDGYVFHLPPVTSVLAR